MVEDVARMGNESLSSQGEEELLLLFFEQVGFLTLSRC